MSEVATRKTKPKFRAEDAPLLKTAPTNWDESFAELRKSDFEKTAVPEWMEWKAGIFEKKAAQLKADAVEWRKSGGKSSQAAQRKYLKLLEKIAELEGQLAGSGVDVSAIRASVQ